MRRSLLFLALLACGAPADDEATDDTEVGDDTDDTTGGDTDDTDEGGDTDDTTGGDTDATGDDTDDTDVPFTPVGTWSMSGGVVTAAGAPVPTCGPPGTQASSTTDSFTWVDGSPARVTHTGFNIPFNCTLDGLTATCAAEYSVYRDQGSYERDDAYATTITFGGGNTATVDRTSTSTCIGGDCANASFCPSQTVRWTATRD